MPAGLSPGVLSVVGLVVAGPGAGGEAGDVLLYVRKGAVGSGNNCCPGPKRRARELSSLPGEYVVFFFFNAVCLCCVWCVFFFFFFFENTIFCAVCYIWALLDSEGNNGKTRVVFVVSCVSFLFACFVCFVLSWRTGRL